jgi:hypothetical protein
MYEGLRSQLLGIPSILSSLEYDCAPPRNVMDLGLYPDMRCLPESQSNSLFSDVSYLHCSLQSISLRVRLCAVANSLRSSGTFQDLLRDEHCVQDALARIPKWKEAHTLLTWTLLDLQLRQFIFILHTQRALNSELGVKPEHRYSVLTSLEASATLIDRHVELMETNNFALCSLRFDYLSASLLICRTAYYANLASGKLCLNAYWLSSTKPSCADNIIVRVAKAIFEESMDKSFRLLEQRSLRPGRGDHHYWCLSAAYSLVNIQFEPGRAQALERQATDRVCKLEYKKLSLRDEPLEDYIVQEVRIKPGGLTCEVRILILHRSYSATGLRLRLLLVKDPPPW